jgi:hypothetical protein
VDNIVDTPVCGDEATKSLGVCSVDNGPCFQPRYITLPNNNVCTAIDHVTITLSERLAFYIYFYPALTFLKQDRIDCCTHVIRKRVVVCDQNVAQYLPPCAYIAAAVVDGGKLIAEEFYRAGDPPIFLFQFHVCIAPQQL